MCRDMQALIVSICTNEAQLSKIKAIPSSRSALRSSAIFERYDVMIWRATAPSCIHLLMAGWWKTRLVKESSAQRASAHFRANEDLEREWSRRRQLILGCCRVMPTDSDKVTGFHKISAATTRRHVEDGVWWMSILQNGDVAQVMVPLIERILRLYFIQESPPRFHIVIPGYLLRQRVIG